MRRHPPLNIEVADVQRHRNGISGEPFYLLTFTATDAQESFQDILKGIVFERDFERRDKTRVVVIDPIEPVAGFKGEDYADALFAAIDHKCPDCDGSGIRSGIGEGYCPTCEATGVKS